MTTRIATGDALNVLTPVKAGCPEGGTVLDPFSGSGTTAIVCERLKRSFLGIELNPEYVEIAKTRIRGAREQLAKERQKKIPKAS